MKRRVAVKGDMSSARLLQVAAHLFREKGFLATSVRDIALAANMKSGSIYYHYPSKDALLEAVMDRAIGAFNDAVGAALVALGPDHTFQDRFKVAVAAHLRTVHQYGDFAVASRESLDKLPEKSRQAHVKLRRQYGEIWRQLFEQAKKDGLLRTSVDTVSVLMFILGALNWSSEWLDPQRTDLEAAAGHFSDLVLNGLLEQRAVSGRPAGRARPSPEYPAAPRSRRQKS